MKKCPYCAEEIQDEAIKCKHCGEFIDKGGESPPPLSHEYPKRWSGFKTKKSIGIIIFSVLFILEGLGLVISSLVFSIEEKEWTVFWGCLFFSIPFFAVGIGIFMLKEFVRKIVVIISGLYVILIIIPPFNTAKDLLECLRHGLIAETITYLFCGILVYYFTRPKVKEQFRKKRKEIR